MSKVIVKFSAPHGVYNAGDAAGFSADRARTFVASGIGEIMGEASSPASDLGQIDVLAGLPAGQVSHYVEELAKTSLNSDAVKARIAELAEHEVEVRVGRLALADAEKTLTTAKIKARIKTEATAIVEVRVSEMVAARAAAQIAAQEAEFEAADSEASEIETEAEAEVEVEVQDDALKDPQAQTPDPDQSDELPAQG